MSKLRYFLQESWLLMVSSVVFGVLLAATDSAWKPRIMENEINKFSNLAGGLVAGAAGFERVSGKIQATSDGKIVDVDVRKGCNRTGDCVGWAFLCQGRGFADKIKLVVAVDANFEKLIGFGVLSSSETPGFGDKITVKNGFFQSQFKGAPAAQLTLVKTGDDKQIDDKIVAITGATITSVAVVDALNAYIVPIKEQLTQKGFLRQTGE